MRTDAIRLGPLLLAVCCCGCAPLTTTTQVHGPVIEHRATETIALDRKQPPLRAVLRGPRLTLVATKPLICLRQRMEHRSSTIETTVEPNKGVVTTEIAVAAVFLGWATLVGATGTYKELPGQGDEDPAEEPDHTAELVVFVGLPATIGAISALAAGVDISHADHRNETKHRQRRLPDSYGPCSHEAIEGLPVQVRQGKVTLTSRFGADAKARFDLSPVVAEALAADPSVDVYVGEKAVGVVVVTTHPGP